MRPSASKPEPSSLEARRVVGGTRRQSTRRPTLRPLTRTKITTHDPWQSALVWVLCGVEKKLWQPARVVGYDIVNELTSDWRFSVELTDGSRLDITSAAVDKFNLEFQHVKRRDKDPNGVRSLTICSPSLLNIP